MIFPLTAAAVFLVPTIAIALLWALVLWLRGRLRTSFWIRAGWVHLALFAVHLFGTFPAALGWFGSRGLGTRGDERAYQGPRIGQDGAWTLQSRASLRDEKAQPPKAG